MALRALIEHREEARASTLTVDRLRPLLTKPVSATRQLNSALRIIMVITQIRHPTAGRDFYQRKRAEGQIRKPYMP